MRAEHVQNADCPQQVQFSCEEFVRVGLPIAECGEFGDQIQQCQTLICVSLDTSLRVWLVGHLTRFALCVQHLGSLNLLVINSLVDKLADALQKGLKRFILSVLVGEFLESDHLLNDAF